MSKYKLTPVKEELPNLDVGQSQDTPTADLIEYGLRSHCLDGEYHLANRLQKLRCVALELIEQLDEEGYNIDALHLQLIDVEVEVSSTKRLTI